MYEIVFFSKYISHKNEINVNNLTQDQDQNFIYLLEVFKYDLIEPKHLNKSQNLLLKEFIKKAFSTAYYPFRIKQHAKPSTALFLILHLLHVI